MGIDFSKRSQNKSVEKKIHPCEIYDTLDRHANKGPLRVPIQKTVLNKWFDEYQEKRDVILKLPTGEGKTLIGLLILQSKINQKKGSALFVCPNKYLAEQVKTQADEFGIQYCSIEQAGLPEDFMNGEKLLITHAHMLFNGRSKNFGIGNNSINVDNIILDDAHSCIEIIKSSCKFQIHRSSECYSELLQLFIESLKSQGSGTFADINNKSNSAILAVPYWDWQSKTDEVVDILSKYNRNRDKGVWFAWELIKNNIKNCFAVFSGSEIEISPYALPIEEFGAFSNASHKVFMSATISNDSFFIRDLGLKKEIVESPLTFNKKWSGEKMVLIPSLIDGCLTREEIINWIGKWKNTSYGVVAITPSNWHTKIWVAIGSTLVDTNNFFDEIDNLKSNHFRNPIVMAAKYDGVDLPDNMCRILILDSLPTTETITEKFIETCIPNSTFTKIKTAQTIEQGLGRAVRGEKDYCAVLLLGNDLVKQIRYRNSRDYLSPQTKKQIDIGLELAKFSKEDKKETETFIEMLSSVLEQSLRRDESWKNFYAESMDSIELEDRERLKADEIIIMEREAENLFNEGKYDDASNTLQSLLDKHSDSLSKNEKGWYLQDMSRYLYAKNRVEGIALQVQAHRTNKSLFLPPDGYQITKIEMKPQERISNIKNRIYEFRNFEDLLVYMDDVFSRLVFGVKADKFENAIDELGYILGFNTERPDKNWKAGPDNLWAIREGQYLFIECKSEVSLNRAEITKAETGQFNNNIAWFKRFYPGAQVKYTIIIPTKKVKSNTGFSEKVFVLRQKGLRSLVANSRSFILGFSQTDLKSLSDELINKSIGQHKLSADNLLSQYFEVSIIGA
jgi:tetratricopeptide (TPR) repeat protein